MTNAAEVSDRRYKLEIAYDTDPQNPREWDNLGTMVCWHRRYSLGDDHTYSDMDDLLASLIRDGEISDDSLISYVKSGKADGLRLEYNKSNREWDLTYYDDYFKKWYSAGSYDAPLDSERGIVADDILENMRTDDLLDLAEKAYIIKPLFLYDHSVQSISTRSFRRRAHHADWDSGQVGVVYVSFENIKKEYGEVSPESIEKANKVITAEVEDYDRYIRGESYGFRLFEGGEEVDSCWGFLESFDDALKSISEYLPQEAKYLAKNAEYGTCKVAEPQKDLLGRVGKAKAKSAAQSVPAHSQDLKKTAETLG
jgi:hypothetical protein